MACERLGPSVLGLESGSLSLSSEEEVDSELELEAEGDDSSELSSNAFGL